MQNFNKPKTHKASELIMNFSRGKNTESFIGDDPSLKVKSRKLAFTSRIMHPLKKVDPLQIQSPNLFSATPKFNSVIRHVKLPDNPISFGKKKSTQRSLKTQPQVFSFRSTEKKKVLIPKILKISVSSSKTRSRSFSARSMSQKFSVSNPQNEVKYNPFEITFGSE